MSEVTWMALGTLSVFVARFLYGKAMNALAEVRRRRRVKRMLEDPNATIEERYRADWGSFK